MICVPLTTMLRMLCNKAKLRVPVIGFELLSDLTNPLLFEMVRSFSMLAQELNLSHAVAKLGSTRQTVRRHIATLEELKGEQLFRVVDRQYTLTEAGIRALPQAEEIIALGHAWLRGQSSHVNGLQYLRHQEDNGWYFYQQQHALRSMWDTDSALLRETVRSWIMCGGRIEAPEMQHIRPYLIIYRFTPVGWICVEFGDESFFVRWFGKQKALSSVGQTLGKMPGGNDFARMLNVAFQETDITHNPRLDHVRTMVPRSDGGQPMPVNYRRLMLSGAFPDGSSALLSLVEPSADLDIFGFGPEDFREPDEDFALRFDPDNFKYGS
ncbi:hypothetical protein ASD8599_03323 [Ascidiaceihabitans donghaensis]|uniref:HTH lysR-type domain-containing protein n=1 Tax=Ascidiaceihabitans donghaensis TaxID=1510460 RepID=A0A2R8BHT4_9RHOB|nr:hypothetical protein ASD8599_03323 [Ascidiaceihabitans donghaensis]